MPEADAEAYLERACRGSNSVCDRITQNGLRAVRFTATRVCRVIVQGLPAVQPRTHELWIIRRILD
jgi:hypothetical protein